VFLGLLPFFYTDTRTPVSCRLLAADARGGSCPRAGSCVSTLTEKQACELWRLRPTRSSSIALESQARHALRFYLESMGQAPPSDVFHSEVSRFRIIGDALGSSCKWREGFGVDLPKGEHVNLSEFRATRLTIRKEIKRSGGYCRLLSLSDSNVVTCAEIRGRSRSKNLIQLQRQLVPELLLKRVYLGFFPVSSAKNPSDAPSRDQKLPDPDPDPVFSDFFHRDDCSVFEQVLDYQAELIFRDRWIVDKRQVSQSRAGDEWCMSAEHFLRTTGVTDRLGQRVPRGEPGENRINCELS